MTQIWTWSKDEGSDKHSDHFSSRLEKKCGLYNGNNLIVDLSPSSVTLKLVTLVLPTTHCHMMVNICIKFSKNPLIHGRVTAQTSSTDPVFDHWSLSVTFILKLATWVLRHSWWTFVSRLIKINASMTEFQPSMNNKDPLLNLLHLSVDLGFEHVTSSLDG